MGITSGIVLYAVFWFLTFLIVIPIRLQTQGDVGEVVPGTHAGAPAHHNLKKKAWITTGVAFVIWAIVAAIILTEAVSLDDLAGWHSLLYGN
jgi:predicted secreted protein